jgi:hypothetical protein
MKKNRPGPYAKVGPKKLLRSQKRISKNFSLYRDDLQKLDFIIAYRDAYSNGVKYTQSNILRDLLDREYYALLELEKRRHAPNEQKPG